MRILQCMCLFGLLLALFCGMPTVAEAGSPIPVSEDVELPPASESGESETEGEEMPSDPNGSLDPNLTDPRERILSPALAHFANRTDMAVAGLSGRAYSFSEEVFMRGMNLSKIEYITVLSLPKGSDGTLYLGSSSVQEGQVISRANIGLLSYEAAAEGSMKGSFTFSVDAGGYAVSCSVYTVTAVNKAPTLSYVPVSALSGLTYRGLPYTGTLSGYDADGDRLVYEIVSGAANGSVELMDRESGRYCYTPYSGYTGEDSFSYVVRDLYGNYSGVGEVKVSVKAPSEATVFSDLSSDSERNAALTVSENGIMSGTRVGETVCFYPEQELTRAEFVVMAMKAVGISPVSDSERAGTVFADHEEIPEGFRGYIKTAYEMGAVNGIFSENGLEFLPSRAVTRVEAAAILSSLFASNREISEKMTPHEAMVAAVEFSSSDGVPAWAEGTLAEMYALGVMANPGDAMGALSRMEAAEIFAVITRVVK